MLCLNCDKELDQSKGYPVKFCSKSCAATYNNKRRRKPRPKCINCGKELKKNASKYCSNVCQMEHQEKDKLSKWLNGEIKGYVNGGSYTLYKVVREYIFDRAGNKCEECKFDKVNPFNGNRVVQIDHIDGDASNDRPENLKVLCPTCHAMTPTFGNAGSRESKRRDWRNKTRSI